VRDAGAKGKSLHQLVVLLRVEVAVSVQHDRDRRVVSEIVDAEWFEAGGA